MCRTTDFQYFNDRDRLKVKSFYVRLSNLHLKNKQFPECLTLVYLPRIGETALQISGKNSRPDSPAFVTLHRVITEKTDDGEVVYGNREPVVASEGVTFEVFLGEEKILKGIFRKDEKEEWKLECKCVLEKKTLTTDDEVARADVCVGVDGHVRIIIQRVEMVVKRKRNRRRSFRNGLQGIPEERETDIREFEPDDGGCSCGDVESRSDGEELEEINMEGVSWAVDVGIWVVCLGLGFLVAKTSAKGLRRKSIF